MNEATPAGQRRAARLVRWYPKDWRARYGDEFSELLAAQIADQPRSWTRILDVAVGAIMAHLAAAGLSGRTVDPSDQRRRSLATFGCALAIFLTFAVSIWSHLSIASRLATPTTSATHTAIIVMTIAVALCVAAAVAGAIPIAWTAARRSEPGLRRPALLFLAGISVLIVGGLAFHNGWPASGSHPWSDQSPSLGGPSGFMWASTLAVSAYWAHPTILLSLPPSEIAWMAISPIALIGAGAGAAKTVRELDLSIRLLRFATHTAQLAIVGLGLFLLGTLAWLIDGGPGPAHLFQPGTVDQIGLVVMTATMIVAVRSMQRTTALPLGPQGG
jgi:hypothetical protein